MLIFETLRSCLRVFIILYEILLTVSLMNHATVILAKK